MKKSALLILILLAFSLALAGLVLADSKDDFQAIKKAVKENPSYEEGKEAKWFKVLITDARTNKERVKITLPIALIEVLIAHCHDRDMRMHRDKCDIDLKALFAELKKLGPMALIEINEDDEIVKIWVE
jgi:cytochrome bd-type quinol oxidase subunit 1